MEIIATYQLILGKYYKILQLRENLNLCSESNENKYTKYYKYSNISDLFVEVYGCLSSKLKKILKYILFFRKQYSIVEMAYLIQIFVYFLSLVQIINCQAPEGIPLSDNNEITTLMAKVFKMNRANPNQSQVITSNPQELSDYIYQKNVTYKPTKSSTNKYYKKLVNCKDTPLFNGQDFCLKSVVKPKLSDLDRKERHKLDIEFAHFFGDDLPTSITDRFNNEEFLCETRESTIYPEMGLNSNDEYKNIVNYKKYKQGVRIEYCGNEGSACTRIEKSVPKNYKTKCVQLYAYSPMAAYSFKNLTIYKDYFRFPSSCKCALVI